MRTVVDDHTKTIKNALFLSHYFCSIQKLAQYIPMALLGLERRTADLLI